MEVWVLSVVGYALVGALAGLDYRATGARHLGLAKAIAWGAVVGAAVGLAVGALLARLI